MKKILVPIDFSPGSSTVVAEAEELARACGGRITLVHVVEPPAAVIDYGLVNLNVPEITAAGEKYAAGRLAHWQEKLQRPDAPVETVLATGFPVIEITGLARKIGAHYIVIGSHGHGAFFELLIGSTTSGVLKKAPCPVLIVPTHSKRHEIP